MARGPGYVAILSGDDYAQFRERDPRLPELYPAWLTTFHERVRALREKDRDVRTPKISFSDLAERNGILRISSFDEATRDDYAAEQAVAEAVTWRSWLKHGCRSALIKSRETSWRISSAG